MVKFNLHNITDTETGLKVKVTYSRGVYIDGSEGITIYEDGYSRKLFKMFSNAVNESESMTDYFECTRVRLTLDSPFYNEALKVVKRLEESNAARRLKKAIKYGYAI